MKRSGSCPENMSDLIFAVLANPSGRYKGQTLLEYCYQKMDVWQTFHHFSWEDRTVYVTLYEMLLEDGADAGVFLCKNAEDISYLQKAVCEALKLIRVLLLEDRSNGNRVKKSLRDENGFERLMAGATALMNFLKAESTDLIMDDTLHLTYASGSETEQTVMLEEKILPLSCTSDLEAVQSAVLKGAILPFTCVDEEEMNKLNGMNGMVASFFENCMHGIFMLNQPCLPLLEAAILNGVDVSWMYHGVVMPIYTAERLLTVSADALRLLTKTMQGRGVGEMLRDLKPVLKNFSELRAVLRQLLDEVT